MVTKILNYELRWGYLSLPLVVFPLVRKLSSLAQPEGHGQRLLPTLNVHKDI